MEPYLVLPDSKYKESFLQALDETPRELHGSNLDVDKYAGDFDAFLQKMKDDSEGKNMEEGRVAQTVYWLVEGEKFIGRFSVRHELNDHLMKVGGHLGYAIRESERNKGYGNLILKLGLIKTKELGITKALITCRKTNEASKKIIEKNGGVFENEVEFDGGITLRYWITL